MTNTSTLVMCPFETYEHADVTVELYYDDDSNPRKHHDNAGTIVSFTNDFDGDEYLSVDCPVCGGSGEDQERYELRRYSEHGFFTVVGAGSYESMLGEFERSRKPDPLHPHQSDGTYGLEPKDCPHCDNGTFYATIEQYIRHEFDDAEVIIPLRFSDYGSSGSDLGETDPDNANAIIYVSAETLQKEWNGDREKARKCMEAEVEEYSQWMSGEVYGYVIKDADGDDLPSKMQDSCWGFVGDTKYVREEASSAAEYVAEQLANEAKERDEMAARDIETVASINYEPKQMLKITKENRNG